MQATQPIFTRTQLTLLGVGLVMAVGSAAAFVLTRPAPLASPGSSRLAVVLMILFALGMVGALAFAVRSLRLAQQAGDAATLALALRAWATRTAMWAFPLAALGLALGGLEFDDACAVTGLSTRGKEGTILVLALAVLGVSQLAGGPSTLREAASAGRPKPPGGFRLGVLAAIASGGGIFLAGRAGVAPLAPLACSQPSAVHFVPAVGNALGYALAMGGAFGCVVALAVARRLAPPASGKATTEA